MDADKRVVTSLPLTELWDRSGPVAVTRGRDLDREGVAQLLRDGVSMLVLADVGCKLDWVAPDRRFDVWRNVRDRIIPPNTRPPNDSGLRYRASEWNGTVPAIVVLEANH